MISTNLLTSLKEQSNSSFVERKSRTKLGSTGKLFKTSLTEIVIYSNCNGKELSYANKIVLLCQ